MLAVAGPWWDRLRIRASELQLANVPEGASRLMLLEPGEGHVAGRVGLCAAVRQHLDAGPAEVRRQLAEVGRRTRGALIGVPGWKVVGGIAAPSAITALLPAAGQDVTAVRARLLARHKIVTSAALPARAPREMSGPLLRISPHVDCTPQDLETLSRALAETA